MFFESVPDEFVDVKTENWDYHEGSKDIPIIIPRNYLDLYNFGFAQSRNMPKLSEGILGAMKLMLSIRKTPPRTTPSTRRALRFRIAS